MGSQCHTESQETSWWQLGSPTPPPLCHSWPMRWEMDCPPLVKGQYCSGGSRGAPHSSVHYSFCNQAENNRAFWLSSKWKLSASYFLKVSGTLGLGKFSCVFQDQKKKKHQAWAVGVCVGERYASLLQANKSLEWFLGRSGLLIAKRRMFGPESIIS